MAKTLTEENLRLNIVVNGNNARKEIGELSQKTRDLSDRNKELRSEQRRLKADGKEQGALFKQNAKEIKTNENAIKSNQEQIKRYRSEMALNSMTTSELTKRQSELRVALRNAVPGTSEWKRLSTELRAVTSRMSQLRSESAATQSTMSRLSSGLSKHIGAVMATVATVAIYGSKLYTSVKSFLRLDEAMSNARKTTGMTRREIEALGVSLAKIDTRTAQEELLSMARIAGKLGLAKQDIEGFVRAADVIKVSLAKDLGNDVETTIGQIGKLVNVFKLAQKYGIEVGMMKTAAAVNELGKSSVANEANIVEFMRRVGSVGASANMSLANIAGLGATLDALGVTMEVSGTSMSQVITGMFRRTDAFAAAAKMSVKDFRKLMAEDMNEAIVRFAEGMGKDDAGVGKIVAILDTLNLDGTRATNVLSTLARGTEMLREQQLIANKAFEEGTSCLKEFNVMNNSATGLEEKRIKAIAAESAALGKALVPAYLDSLSVKAQFIKVSRILIGWLIRSKATILGLITAYTSYKAVMFVARVAVKAYSVALAISKKIEAGYALGVRATTIATIAQIKATKTATLVTRLFAIAWRASPLGWVASGIGAIVGAFTYFTLRANAATKSQKAFNEVSKIAAEVEDEHGVNLVGRAEKIRHLMRVVEDETTAENTRIAAIKELQSLMPNGTDLINDETIASGKAAKAVSDHTDQLILQAMIKAALQKEEEIINKAAQDKLTGEDKKVGWLKRSVLWLASARSYGILDYSEMIESSEKANEKAYKESIDRQLKQISTIRADLQLELNSKTTTPAVPIVDEPTGTSDPYVAPVSDDKKTWSLDNDAKFLEAKRKLRQQFASGSEADERLYQANLLEIEIGALQNRLAINKESGASREKLEIQLSEKLTEHKRREVSEARIADDLRIQNITDVSQRAQAEYDRERQKYAGNKAALVQLEIQHNRRMANLQLQKATKALEQQESEHKQARQILQDRHRLEVQTSTLAGSEKKRLRQAQNDELKAFDEQYLNDIRTQLQALSGAGMMAFRDIKGIIQTIDLDTDLLSEDEKNKLLVRIQEVTKALDATAETLEEATYSFSGQKSDILGFTLEDWDLFFDNIKAGKFGVDEFAMALMASASAASAAMDLYSSYDKMMSAKENAELKKYQKNQERKTKANQDRLSAGLMTEAQATAEEERMKAELDAKQEALQAKQAKRQKTMSIGEAIINTAVGVSKSLTGLPWPLNILAAAATAAMGAAQVAMIASTPIAGAEAGGLVAERMQDGRKFNAKDDPDARGYIDQPTVLVSENGMEYVIPNEAMANPTAKPIISMFESVRRRGQLRDFDFSQVLPAMMRTPGLATGGSVGLNSSLGMPSMPIASGVDDATLKKLYEAIDKLIAKLDDPLLAYVTMLGKNGLVAKMDEYKRNRERGNLG